MFGASPAAAETIKVTSLGNAGSGTLRAALESAPANATIEVPAGTINLAPPALPVTQNVTVVGAGAGATIIDGDSATRVITVTGAPTVTLEGLTITEGMSQFGAGIFSTGGATLTLKGVVMTDNHARGVKLAGFGGAIESGPGAVNVIESTLSHNNAGGGGEPNAGFGGAIFYEEGGSAASFSLSIQRSSLVANTAGGTGGAGFGGAIELDTSHEGARLSFSMLDSSLSENVAGTAGKGAGFGGGMEFDSNVEGSTTSFVIERSAIVGNVAGGASAEAAGFGGGLEYDVKKGSPTARIVNSTVALNSAGGGGSNGFGGGIEGEAVLPLSFDTIVGNTAGGGGGKAFGAGVELGKTSPVLATVIAENPGGDCLSEEGKAQFVSQGHNLVDDTTCGIAGPGDLEGVPAGLGPLAADGGPTLTVPPLPGSPLVDSGPATGCPETDQRGIPRPQGPACDIGAVELAPPRVATGLPRGLTATSETVSATASNPGLLGGTVSFQYGTSSKYGSQTGPQTLPAGTGLGAFTAVVSGLSPHTVYHYRAIASTPDGTAFGADATFTTPGASLPAPPVLTHLAQTRSTWRLGHGLARLSKRAAKGTVFSFELNEAATVTLRFVTVRVGRLVKHRCVAPKRSNLHHHGCPRTLPVGTIALSGHAGRDRVGFAGLFAGGKQLAPGGYILEATASDAFGQRSSTQRIRFRVVR